MNSTNETSDYPAQVAIIGMSGRFPRAASLDEYWINLRDGVECATTFSDEELVRAGVAREFLPHPGFVRKRPFIPDADFFDAAFFGYSPREAELIDPQQRLFLECCWEALEQAAYDPASYRGAIGVYGGVGISTYFLHNIFGNQRVLHAVGLFPALLANDKDFFTTRVSYKLDLRGPSVNVLTGCSSSLVAVHMACQSLLNGECEMAIAGGATILFPQQMGYLFSQGGVNSPDGSCRSFDAAAQGTIPGDGVGAVLLKRLDAALSDGDFIHAIIRGSAINNDGALKAGFAAPSVEGQSSVISQALAVAGVRAEEITYLEAHGTGTPLGDPIEVSALTQAFHTNLKNYCALGSVKPNIGHTDAAAGIAGLIKIVLAMKHKQIPPTLHFEKPNPQIDFANSPFFVQTTLGEWQPESSRRFAGVSSFGVGGTNAHVILEEPVPAAVSAPDKSSHLCVLSARSAQALDSMGRNLSSFLAKEPGTRLADVSYTLHSGRRAFAHRRAVVCRTIEELRRELVSPDAQPSQRSSEMDEPQIVFLFPGQGTQYAEMGRGLYEGYAEFREEFDRCAELLKPHLGRDLREVVFAAPAAEPIASSPLYQTDLTQPALFTIEYALARLLMRWNIQPTAMLGHSVGEYVCACLASVMSLEDALKLIALRGRLIQQQRTGSMLAVLAGETRLRRFLGGDVAVAAINSDTQTVLSGTESAIEHVAALLKTEGITCRPLYTSRAFHSSMLDPILYPFTEAVRRIRLSAPCIPYISNLTGTWITAAEATDPQYWSRHLRHTVLFSKGLQELLNDRRRLFLEVGPGKTLTVLGWMHARENTERFIPTMRNAAEEEKDSSVLLDALGQIWRQGAGFEWPGDRAVSRPRRIPLPTYPFERKRYFVQPSGAEQPAVANLFEAGEREDSGGQPGEAAPAHDRRPELRSGYAPPSNEIEEQLVLIWQDLLGIEPIGIHDNIFELGGHSLMAAQLITRLQATFPIEISIRDLMNDGSTIAELAQTIDRQLVQRLESLSDEDVLLLLQQSDSNKEGAVN